MRQKMAIFKERISVCRDAKISRSFHFIFLMKNRGDDATENVNFQRGKQRLQGAKISSSILMSFSMKDRGTMRQEMSIFKEGNSVCRVQKSQVEF